MTVSTVGNTVEAVSLIVPTIATKSSSYTLVLGDADNDIIEMDNGGTLTIPTNASVPFLTGTQIMLVQTGASQVTVAGVGGVTVNATPGLKLRAQWSSATLMKRDTNTWLLTGDLSA